MAEASWLREDMLVLASLAARARYADAARCARAAGSSASTMARDGTRTRQNFRTAMTDLFTLHDQMIRALLLVAMVHGCCGIPVFSWRTLPVFYHTSVMDTVTFSDEDLMTISRYPGSWLRLLRSVRACSCFIPLATLLALSALIFPLVFSFFLFFCSRDDREVARVQLLGRLLSRGHGPRAVHHAARGVPCHRGQAQGPEPKC